MSKERIKDVTDSLRLTGVVLGMLPENPGYNGSILLIDDTEAERAVKAIDDAVEILESAAAAVLACSEIPEYQLTGEGGSPNDLGAMIDSMREEKAKLREQLAWEKADSIARRNDAVRYLQRAEAAESKLRDAEVRLSGQTCFVPPEVQQELDELRAELKALGEQDPVAYAVYSTESNDPHEIILMADYDEHEDCSLGDYWAGNKPLYPAPVPPVDVQELRAKLDAAIDALAERDDKEARQDKRIAELERKLAEHQAAYQITHKLLCSSFNALAGLVSKYNVMRNLEIHFSDTARTDATELNTLRAEAREEGRLSAVPEGIVWTFTGSGSREVTMRFDTEQQSVDFVKLVNRRLAAAPTPGEKP